MMTRDKMITRLKGKISATRLTHSFGVEYTAACLAMVHGEDVEKARIAGLLHDCAKGLPTKTKLEKARRIRICCMRSLARIMHGTNTMWLIR